MRHWRASNEPRPRWGWLENIIIAVFLWGSLWAVILMAMERM